MIINHISLTGADQIVIAKNTTQEKKISSENNQISTILPQDSTDFSVSARMTSKFNGLKQALENISNAQAMIDTADTALSQIDKILQKIKSLDMKSSNDIYTSLDRQKMQVELSALVDEVDRIASQANYNKFTLLSGDYARIGGKASIWFQIGPDRFNNKRMYIATFTAQSLKLKDKVLNITVNVSTQSGAKSAIRMIDAAIEKVAKQRADLNGYTQRFKITAAELINSIRDIEKSNDSVIDKNSTNDLIKKIRYRLDIK